MTKFEERYPLADGKERERVLDSLVESAPATVKLLKIPGDVGPVVVVLDRSGARPISYVLDVRGPTDREKNALQDFFGVTLDQGITPKASGGHIPTTEEIEHRRQEQLRKSQDEEARRVADANKEINRKQGVELASAKANPTMVNPSVASSPNPPAPVGAPYPTDKRPETPPKPEEATKPQTMTTPPGADAKAPNVKPSPFKSTK